MPISISRFAALAVTLVAAFTAQAAVLCVSPTTGANNPTCGSLATPCRTITYTINVVAQTGDQLILSRGGFSEQVNISKALSISGSGLGKTAISGAGTRTAVIVNAPATISNLTIELGATSNCGGGLINNSSLVLQNVVVDSSSALAGVNGRGLGGGICNNSTLTLLGSTVTDNIGSEAGGIFSRGTLYLYNSTVNNNGSAAAGGGIEFYGNAYLINSTVASNTANTGGGVEAHNNLYLYNATVSGNTALTGGGIDQEAAGISNIFLQNSILAGNTDTAGEPDCQISLGKSGNYNLIGNTAGCNIPFAPNDLTNVGANLGPLQDNGGSTHTEVPNPGSPAINGGNPSGCLGPNGRLLTVDQRNLPRGTPCDIGSVEVQNP